MINESKEERLAMTLKGKSIFIASIGFIVFAMLRQFIPISNMLFL